jgi:hypothetical protein
MNVEKLEFQIFESTTSNSQVDLLKILTTPLGFAATICLVSFTKLTADRISLSSRL